MYVSEGIVHENVKMGSDGESDQASGTSSDEVQSPVRVRMRNNHSRRICNEVIICPHKHELQMLLVLINSVCTEAVLLSTIYTKEKQIYT